MILLGSTGSIGVNTLNIARRFNIEVDVLVAGENIKLLNSQIEEFKPSIVVVSNKESIKDVNHQKVLYAETGILEAINSSNSKLVVNSLVGYIGLKPTLEAIKRGKKIALANKESLVVGGEFIDISNITPIDSEHFGLWYLLNGRELDKMTITASGGAFRDTPLSDLYRVTTKQALNHPNWSMGKKITIDSATMANKLFELLEAKWLFNSPSFDAIIETKSIIHALIDFKDGSTTAHIANTDMRLPISYAILNRVNSQILKPVDLTKVQTLEFRKIEANRYPIWEIKDDILSKPHLGVVVNASNEVAVEKFLKKEISFLDISKIVLNSYKHFYNFYPVDVDDIFRIDKEVREFIKRSLKTSL